MERIHTRIDAKDTPEKLFQGKFVFLFPGQGAQKTGMAEGVSRHSEAAQDIFHEADRLFQHITDAPFTISELCFDERYAQALRQTEFTQPAIFTASVAELRAIQERFPDNKPSFVAGHSLGEYAALVAAGALSFADGLELVVARGKAMKESEPGAMAALVGLTSDKVSELCNRVGVYIATKNSEFQTTISGQEEAVLHAISEAKTMGARLATRLDISIASHSPLMQGASEKIAALLSQMHFSNPEIPLILNHSGEEATSAEQIREGLPLGLVKTVLWDDSVNRMYGNGIRAFLEVGPGNVLSNLTGKILGSERSRQTTVMHAEQLLSV